MIDLTHSEWPRKKTGGARVKKAALKIDMTPMVDLGFLLISFFIFTTEISKPVVTRLLMPHKGIPVDIPESRSLTILLGADRQAIYYFGSWQTALANSGIHETSYGESDGIGDVIRKKQDELATRNMEKHHLIVVIKPGSECSYADVVNALDEMLVNDVTQFVLVDQQPGESAFLNRLHPEPFK